MVQNTNQGREPGGAYSDLEWKSLFKDSEEQEDHSDKKGIRHISAEQETKDTERPSALSTQENSDELTDSDTSSSIPEVRDIKTPLSDTSKKTQTLSSEIFEAYQRGIMRGAQKKVDAVNEGVKEAAQQMEAGLAEREKGIQEKVLDETKKVISQKVEGITLKIIQTLGIFVALFTFVSVDIQIFKSSTSLLSATGLSFIILGSLLSFICALFISTNYKEGFYKQNKKLIIGILVFIIVLIGGGVFAVYYDDKDRVTSEELKNNNKNFYTKEETEKFLELKTQEIDKKDRILNDMIKNETLKVTDKEVLEGKINTLANQIQELKSKNP